MNFYLQAKHFEALCTCSLCILRHPTSSRAKFRTNFFNLTQPDSKLVTLKILNLNPAQRFHCSSPRTLIKIRVEWFASFGSHFDPICVHFGPEQTCSKILLVFAGVASCQRFSLRWLLWSSGKSSTFFCVFLNVFLYVFLHFSSDESLQQSRLMSSGVAL